MSFGGTQRRLGPLTNHMQHCEQAAQRLVQLERRDDRDAAAAARHGCRTAGVSRCSLVGM